MISLNDQQLGVVMDAARAIDSERRSQFLERCAAMLRLRARFADADVVEIAMPRPAWSASRPRNILLPTSGILYWTHFRPDRPPI